MWIPPLLLLVSQSPSGNSRSIATYTPAAAQTHVVTDKGGVGADSKHHGADASTDESSSSSSSMLQHGGHAKCPMLLLMSSCPYQLLYAAHIQQLQQREKQEQQEEAGQPGGVSSADTTASTATFTHNINGLVLSMSPTSS
jgi:hypothetical protein